MPIRKFASVVAPLEGHWFDVPIQEIPVEVRGEFSATADGACPITLSDGKMAYLKPRPDANKNLVVAREKLAADLAHVLSLPVAPVVVRRPDPKNNFLHHSAVSLVCLSSGRTWGAGGMAYLAQCAEALEALRVFWTWIGDTDHNGHPGNLIYQVRTGSVDVVAIDHSYSFCHQNSINPLTTGACNGYQTEHLSTSLEVRRTVVAAILGLNFGEVERLVRRLDEILTGAEQDRILNIIDVRTKELIKMLRMEGG